MLNRIFFPEDTAAIGIPKSMVVVGVAYVVRPFGAMIVGPSVTATAADSSRCSRSS